MIAEPGGNNHVAEDAGTDHFHANRMPDRSYRTALVRRLGRIQRAASTTMGEFATLSDVIDHYNTFKRVGLNHW